MLTMVGSGDELGATSRHILLAISLKVSVEKRGHEECRRIRVLSASERIEGAAHCRRFLRRHLLATVVGCRGSAEGEGTFSRGIAAIVPCDM